MAKTVLKNEPSLYDRDFHAWARAQAHAVEQRRLPDIDWSNIAEELDDLGKSKPREIRNRLKILLLHLLKWHFQPERRKGGWAASIREQRQEIADIIDESPSLRNEPSERLAWAYARARGLASDETGLPLAALPETCPFSIEDALREDWLPEGTGE